MAEVVRCIETAISKNPVYWAGRVYIHKLALQKKNAMKKWNIIITCGIILLLILVLTPNEDKLNLPQKCSHHSSLKGVACNNSKLEHDVITEKARNAFLQEAQPNVTSEKLQNVGFFSHERIDDSIFHTDFSVMNAYLKFSNSGQKMIDIEHLRQNLEA